MKVFIVEDNSEFLDFLMGSLKQENYEVLGNGDGKNIIPQLTGYKPDLILLDMNLPERDGFDILSEIRGHNEFQRTPIIVITGRDDEKDILRAFNQGADDYLTKPFTLDILWARMKAVLRRTKPVEKNSNKLESQDLIVDLSTHQVFLAQNEIKLTLTEYNILVYLMKKIGQAITRAEVRKEALNDENISDRTLDVHMTSLRKKLAHRGPDVLTIRGVGFRLLEEPAKK